jgi:K+-transporting ATPase KdpF subunit
MTLAHALGGLAVASIIAYLVYAMLKPERF